ncbi:Disease resistance protein TAO1 [Cardamine amara subsp. amara]|uniref:Disease resistance protein TAO1 n=1 Tax=Cardamine amara subsp. amara TaxID=228776 RepID=A0ABD1BXF6_CARAN
MGSYFRGMSQQEWKNALPRLRRRLDREIESIFKFSYDALCDDDKDLFLHIACIFNDQLIEKVEEHLSNSFVDVAQGVHVLTEKSLISINWGYIEVHNLLEQFGREIVRKQSVCQPWQRNFLVNSRDLCEVLSDDTIEDRRSVIGI